MKTYLLLLILLLTISLNAQNNFKKGTLLTKENQEKKGYIRTFGYKLPKTIIFKNDLNSKTYEKFKTDDILQIQFNDVKYIQKTVEIEVLNKNMVAKRKNNTVDFNLTKKKVLLKVDLEIDNITLYSYIENKNEYFFIEKKNIIELLKFKKIFKNGKKVSIRTYIIQLLKDYSSKTNDNTKTISKLKYKKANFISFFTSFAKSNNLPLKIYIQNSSRKFKNAFNITPKIGYSSTNQSYMSDKNSVFYKNFNNSSLNLNLGFDLEYFFNSIGSKHSLVLSYTYHLNNNVQDKFALSSNTDNSIVTDSYQINTLNLNYRYYFKLIRKHFFYLNGGVTFHNTLGDVNYLYESNNYNYLNLKYADNDISLNFGLGYLINKIHIEFNYIPNLTGGFNRVYNDNSTTLSNSIKYNRNNLFNLSLGFSIL